MVQTGAQCTMTSTSSSNIRLTITVTPEVHETFQRIAKAGNMSLSKAMGEWLGDSLGAAQFMAEKMEHARSAPRVVMAEMHAYALGLADETGALMAQIRKSGKTGAASVVPPQGARPLPPSSPPSGNTGGKGTRDSGSPKLRRQK